MRTEKLEVANLSGALKAEKARRNIQSKQIIWESGVSKSQFYRIINGQEAPSQDTKERMCTALCLDIAQFERLYYQSSQQGEFKSEDKTPTYRALWLLGIVLFFPTLVISIATMWNSAEKQRIVTDVDNFQLVDGDSTLFIEDVTIPDGSRIPINTQYVKIWRVKNVGKVTWKNRYLKRTTPASDVICSSPNMIPIPETFPGEIVDLSVTFLTPHLPGSCRTDWKASDINGNFYFPKKHGLYSVVHVVNE